MFFRLIAAFTSRSWAEPAGVTHVLSGGPLCPAQIRPVDVRAKVFAGDLTVGLALDVYCETFSACLPIEGDVSNVSP